MDSRKILVISPEERISSRLQDILSGNGHLAYTHFDSNRGDFSTEESFDLILSVVPNPDGFSPQHPTYRTLIISGKADAEHYLCAEKDGVYDYNSLSRLAAKVEAMIKPIDNSPPKQAVRDSAFKTSKDGEAALARIMGKSRQIQTMKEQIRRISRFPIAPVLITGETGTGKELVANALHACSPRANKPLIKINCAAIPETLFESQLFGHRKGAFSGATDKQKGLVEEADEGTLFLDEISSLKPELQPKLLRFLEDGSYHPVGTVQMKKSNAWIIAASNMSLPRLMAEGKFRNDLYYRLSALPIELSPLRERKEDIIMLAQHFSTQGSVYGQCGMRPLSDNICQKLLHYSWPGNVRELKQMMLAWQLSSVGDFAIKRAIQANTRQLNVPDNDHTPMLRLQEVEKAHIAATLRKTDSNLKKSARSLNISLNTLKRKIRKYSL